MNLLSNPSFAAYVVTCVVLCCNLLFLWIYSGVTRGKINSTPNTEDAARFGASLAPIEPPEIARVLRAHSNAQASIYPFLGLGLIYVLEAGTPVLGTVYFAIFCLARLLHSYAYLNAKQPWRMVFFLIAFLTTVALMVTVLWLLVAGK